MVIIRRASSHLRTAQTCIKAHLARPAKLHTACGSLRGRIRLFRDMMCTSAPWTGDGKLFSQFSSMPTGCCCRLQTRFAFGKRVLLLLVGSGYCSVPSMRHTAYPHVVCLGTPHHCRHLRACSGKSSRLHAAWPEIPSQKF